MFWLGDDKHPDVLGGAVARELPAPPDPVETADDAPAVETAASGTASIEPAEPPVSASALPSNAVAPSAARRECMAQIESAHLFLQFARQSATPEQYAHATQAQIAQMLKAKPVGPRTLNRIAERMWDARQAEQRNAAWWASPVHPLRSREEQRVVVHRSRLIATR